MIQLSGAGWIVFRSLIGHGIPEGLIFWASQESALLHGRRK